MPSLAVLRRLLPYFYPYRGVVALGLGMVVLASAFVTRIPWLLRAAIDAMTAGEPVSRVWTLAGWMIAVTLAGGALHYWMREILNGVSRRIEYDLRNDLFGRLTALDADFYAATRTGEIIARLTNDLNAVRMAAGPAIMYLTNTIAGGAFALYFMVRIDLRLTAIALVPLAAMPTLGIWLGRRIHDRFEAVQAHFGTMTTMAQENLAGVRVVRAFQQESAEVARFAALNDEYVERNMALARLYGIMHPAFGVLAAFGMVATLGVGGSLALRGVITIGAFVAFGMYLAMLTWPMIALGWVINLFQRGAASMRRLLDVLDARSALDPAAAQPVAATLPPSAGGRSIEFRHVSFAYPRVRGDDGSDLAEVAATVEEPRWVLRDVSFTVRAGDTLGVVGATGSGKSALMDLIPRLHDPQEGEILIDGVSIRSIPLTELRREIGYVPQDSFLFSDTIRANLAYGTDDPASPEWAAGVAELSATIADFPGGFATMLGERGINLSGGQKQRTALARALARRPAIVLLDDALSAVDTHTEAGILQGLRRALAGRTSLIASHRISAIRDATWTVVLDGGRVVEQGTHAELLARGGRYHALLAAQQLEEAIEHTELVEAGSPDNLRA